MSDEPPDWLDLLRARTDAFADVLTDADLEAPVPPCPGWTVHDLASHLGGVHEWAAHCITEGNPRLRPEPAPRDRQSLLDWYRACASRLIEVLAATPADAPAWTFEEGNPTALFWRRRQVHETVVHLWDADAALGRTGQSDPLLAWDGVLEVRDVFYPRQVQLGRVEPLPSLLRLVPTDAPGEAVLGAGPPVTVRAPAEVLLRLLWHRADPAAEKVDPRAAALLSAALTP